MLGLQLGRPTLTTLIASAALLEVLWLFSALRCGWRPWCRRFLLALWFLAPFFLASLTLLLAPRGEALPSLWLRSWICLQWAAWTMQNLTHDEFIEGLGRLRVPSAMVETIGLSLRYLELLKDEAQTMARARAARSGANRAPWIWRMRTHGSFVGNLLLRALARSERVQYAMQARGYRGPLRNSGLPFRAADWLAMTGCLGVILCALGSNLF